MLFELQNLKPAEKQYYLQHVIAPRPICFASTIDKHGSVNLSPFSFFNLFSSNPPIVIFSAARRVRDNTTKHTLQNVLEVPEVSISIVTYDMVQQVSLSSCEYAKGVDEFIKAGLSKQQATVVKPPLVKESKVKLECKVIEVKPLGTEGGAGNLIICEVLVMHLDDALLTADLKINQANIEHVARLGGDWYCRVSNQNLFIVPKPNALLGIGIDALPKNIRDSQILTGNHLGMLANVQQIPAYNSSFSRDKLNSISKSLPGVMNEEIHRLATLFLNDNKVEEAWQVLLYPTEKGESDL